jgi:mannose-1-phosphate guanylyltransferase / mannose-6-phosphate isomerase
MSSKTAVCPVILCGGSGTRLWPQSRIGYPKQFLSLIGESSLFLQAVNRLNQLNSNDYILENTCVVTNEEHRFLVLDQLQASPRIKVDILLESTSRNTAPALTLAALHAQSKSIDPILVVTPADQVVMDNQAFLSAIKKSIDVALEGHLAILGIVPKHPETGFGYIKVSKHGDDEGIHAVEGFTEKPSFEKACAYLEAGNYFWNAGIFVVRSSLWLEMIQYFREDIYQATCEAIEEQTLDYQFIRPDPKRFAKIPSDSIDYAVIEKCIDSRFTLKMVELDAGWSDLGSWEALSAVSKKDENNNVLLGDVVISNAKNNFVQSSSRLVTLVGVNDLVVVETPDAILVTDTNQSQHVKALVEALSKQGREEVALHRKVYRPWGWYDTIDLGDSFKVKRICVNPGASLSLQRHLKRSEHWVVVKGQAEIRNGDEIKILNENESTFISLGQKHRLSNPTNEPLEIIEVQTGSYIGEDDIERFEDFYGR